MKITRYILPVLMVLSILYGCKKNKQTDYKDFLGGHEIVYTGAVTNVIIQPGNLQMGLKWKVGSDPTITRYVVYYNNGADSQAVDASTVKNDTIRTVIKGLKEYTYSFTIYSYNAKGNRSLPNEVNNARVYGPLYAGGLLNRSYNEDNPYHKNSDGSVVLYFKTPDTINTKTVITYTNSSGATVKSILKPDVDSVVLKNYKTSSAITYRSYYIPERTAIDTFVTGTESTFPEIVVHYVKCDKALFKEVALPNDLVAEVGEDIANLWDGSVGPQAPPKVFLNSSKGGSTVLPQTFTFDMGKVYSNIGRLEETGSVIPPLNATEFDVWGIADIKNAATTLPGNDAGWETQAKAKGWVLLKSCVRADDGTAAMTFDIQSAPPVRYIRIRVKKTLAVTTVAMSELTFWNIE